MSQSSPEKQKLSSFQSINLSTNFSDKTHLRCFITFQKAEYIRLCKTRPQPAATAGSPSLSSVLHPVLPPTARSLGALDLVRTPLRRGIHCCPYTATLFYLLFEERNLWVVTSLKSTLLVIPNCLYFTACTKSLHTSVPLFMLFLPLGMPIFLCLGQTLPLL